MPNQTLDTLRPELEALPAEDVTRPLIPMPVATQEGHDLATLVAQPHVRDRLVAVGVPTATLERLPLAVDAARAAQSEWVVTRDRTKPEAQRTREEQAYALRGELLAACRWSLRDDRVGLATVAAIAEGEGLEDLIQDLRDLAQLINTRASAFAADTTFEPTPAADRALALAGETEAGLSETRLSDDQATVKDLRDRAYTYLADLMATVREAGHYAFRDDAAMQRQFTSEYRRRRRRRSAKTSGAAATPTTPDTPVAP